MAKDYRYESNVIKELAGFYIMVVHRIDMQIKKLGLNSEKEWAKIQREFNDLKETDPNVLEKIACADNKALGDVYDDLARGINPAPHFSEDTVNHPKHYKQYSQEVIGTIEEVTSQYPGAVGYSVGNAIKYIFRAPFKGNNVEDLKKAVWYLNRAIEKLEE